MAYEQHLIMCYYCVLLNWIISKKKILLNFQFTGLATATLVRTVEQLRVGLIWIFFFSHVCTDLLTIAQVTDWKILHKGRLSF